MKRFFLLMLIALALPVWLEAALETLPRQDRAYPSPLPAAPMYRQTGEQYRVYDFPGSGEPIPYRLYVPESWTPEQRLPVLVTLRAGSSINNSHRGDNDLIREAGRRAYIVISPPGLPGLSSALLRQPLSGGQAGGSFTTWRGLDR